MSKESYNINIQYISYKDLDKMIKCEENKKIIEENVDTPIQVEPLRDKFPIPINLIIKNNKRK